MLFAKRRRVIKRILIVEDEPLVAFDNELFLGSAGYEVVATVDTVEEAVRTIEAEALDLVLADVKLSDGTGLDVARAAQERAVPLLFVTGECPEGARSLAVGCLAKPYGQRDLLEAIEAVDDVLSGRRRRRAPGGLALFR